MKYINADLIKELMKRSIALQGNCEYTLWLQTVDNYVENLPSIDIDSRGHETMSDKVWCSKCRYLYRDFKYGLSCYRLMDDEPCKFEYRKAEPTQNQHIQSVESVGADRKTEPLTCDGNCWMKKQNGEWLCEHCQRKPKTEPNSSEIPNNSTISKMEQVDEPITQTKTQNSNLTFEKDECAKEYEELGLKELKELIEADRKTENSSEIPNNCEHITEDGVTCAKYPACDDCPDNPLNKVKGSKRLLKGKDEPQTDCAWK